MTNTPRNSIPQERPRIINSTSYYLSQKAAIIQNGGNLDDVIRNIHQEGSKALFIPSSEFRTPQELLKEYYDYHFHDLPFDQAQALTKAYLAELNKARKEDRYFTRNPDELSRKYKNPVDGLSDLAGLLERHGFRIKIPRDLSWDLFDDYDIETKVIHQSEPEYVTPSEYKG